MNPPDAPSPTPQTHVFRRVDGHALHADVFGADGRPRPVVLWVHGGGLIFGTRQWVRPHLRQALVDGGAVLVSVDHRLAPETKLAQIVDDVFDALRWIRQDGPALFGADASRVAVAGASAGAYLALLAGCRAGHPLRALATFWGFGDITRPWEAEPSAHYLQAAPHVSRSEALASLQHASPYEPPAVTERSTFYLHTRQQGCWLADVTGHDPLREPGWFDAHCPARLLHPGLPPVMLVHGSDDTDVPCDESRDLAARLAALGVAHELTVLDGIGHGFAGASPERVAEVESRVAAFMLSCLR